VGLRIPKDWTATSTQIPADVRLALTNCLLQTKLIAGAALKLINNST